MSLMRIGLPAEALITVLRTSSKVLKRPSARTISDSSPSFSRPAPSLRLLRSKACCKSSKVIPRADMRARSGVISKLRTKPPREFTSATPATLRSCGRITQSSKLRRSSSDKLPPSIVNINISPSGVVIGAMPPLMSFGRFPHTLFSLSDTC